MARGWPTRIGRSVRSAAARRRAALGTIGFAIAAAASAAIPDAERQALIDLYTSTNGDGWTSTTNWCSGACPTTGTPVFNAPGSECTWYGITCDVAGAHVVDITLPSSNLTGTLPDPGGLAALQELIVSNNHLGGTLPSVAALTQLSALDLGVNAFSGTIPDLSALTVSTRDAGGPAAYGCAAFSCE